MKKTPLYSLIDKTFQKGINKVNKFKVNEMIFLDPKWTKARCTERHLSFWHLARAVQLSRKAFYLRMHEKGFKRWEIVAMASVLRFTVEHFLGPNVELSDSERKTMNLLLAERMQKHE